MKSILSKSCIAGIFSVLLTFAATAAAQAPAAEKEGDGTGTTYLLLFIAIAGVVTSFLLWQRSKKGGVKTDADHTNRYQNYHSKTAPSGDSDLEWLRKAESGSDSLNFQMRKKAAVRPKRTKITATNSAGIDEDALDTKAFQEKMRKMQYGQLPINSITELSAAADFLPLPTSDDEALLNAIDQANEEFEEDQDVRELALRVLAAFRTRNAVETLSQIALYDLAAPVRSKAVAALTDFDHETVFEGILLACADPTREVRATAARGLFRLSFDRADAWKRIIETRDGFRMRHAARAAIEAGIVTKAFERLIHDDMKITYEAVVLVALMITSGETKEIFEAIRTHRDERVRFALLHVLKMMHDERTEDELVELSKAENLPPDVMTRVKETVEIFERVAA